MTIAEVSKAYEISSDTLRYYERIGLIPAVNRTSGGIRNYTEEDLSWVKFAKCMRSAGLKVEALVEYVALFQQGDSTHEARKRILLEQRSQLMVRLKEMQETLDRLNVKIEKYEQVVIPAEKRLKKA